VLTAAERAKAGPKNGAQATATVTLDPVGSVVSRSVVTRT
jgi:2-furoyl-CoA dehydrogenase large subunit